MRGYTVASRGSFIARLDGDGTVCVFPEADSQLPGLKERYGPNLCACLTFVARLRHRIGAARPLTIADMADIVGLDEPAISPDGRTVALLVDRQDMAHAIDIVHLQLLDVRYRCDDCDDSGDRSERSAMVERRAAGFSRSSHGIRQVFTFAANVVTQRTHAARRRDRLRVEPGRERHRVRGNRRARKRARRSPHHHDYFFAGQQRLHRDRAHAARSSLDRCRPARRIARRLTPVSWTIAPTDPGGIFSPQIAWTPTDSASHSRASHPHSAATTRIDALAASTSRRAR